MERPRGPRRVSDRLLRVLVRLLPSGFRYDFGDAIEADVADRRHARAPAGVWRRDVPSLIGAVIREHVDAMRQDVAFAMRMMRRTPVFTATSVLMLALGTGVSLAVFSIIDGVLLHSPHRDPDRIVAVLDREGGRTPTAAVSLEKYRALEARRESFEAVGAFTGGGTHAIGTAGDLTRLDVECVSASLFDVLGVAPLVGRRLSASDDQPGAAPVVVLSYPFWKRLGGSSSIVGSTLPINATPVTVVGVMPRYFAGPLSRSDTSVWLPMARPIAGGGAPGCRPAAAATFNVYARLAPGVSTAQAAAALGTLVLQPLDSYVFSDIAREFTALAGAAGCVLLIACLNVGGLQVERTLARRREMAVRAALGASRGRLARQILTENVVLALLAGAFGVAAAGSTLHAIVALMPGFIPYLEEIEINTRVIMAAVAGASLAGVLAGMLPLIDARHLAPAADLAGSTRVTARARGWTRRAVVVAEIGLSVAVVIAAGLMIRTFVTLRPAHPGFDPRNRISTLVNLQGDAPDARRRFLATLFEDLRNTPGLRRAAATTYLPLSGSAALDNIGFTGGTARVATGFVTSGFFEVMGMPLRAGRAFRDNDTAGTPPVVIVDEGLARQIRPDGNVIGQLIASPPTSTPGRPSVSREIVGVVASTRFSGGSTRPRHTAWMPYAQNPGAVVRIVTESDGRPALALAGDVRRAIQRLEPDLALGDAVVLDTMVDRSVADWRFGAWLFGVFGAFSLVLATIGLTTTTGWWVRQRLREIAVRRALGATTWEIVRLVGRQGLALAAAGIVLGCVLAAGTTRYLQSWLYDITPLDAATFAGAAAGMLAIAALAILVPIGRATRVDPAVALKGD